MRTFTTTLAAAVLAAGAASAQAVISNGTVELGVDQDGQLNIFSGNPSAHDGTLYTGLRHVATNLESTAHGCLCEGWGVGRGDTMVSGAANNDRGGAVGLTNVSFSSTASTATTVTDLNSGGLRVTHAFAPSAATSSLYEVKVTITNTSAAAISDVRYTRTFDWDVEPNTYEDVVTIRGTATTSTLLYSGNDGFVDSDPFAGRSEIGGQLPNTDFVDFGPYDQGTNFDFGFGALAAGESYDFSIFYGATRTESAALAALAAVGAELYSLGQPSSDPLGTGTGTLFGSPVDTATFIFGFAGVGGTPISPIPVPAAAIMLLGGIGALGGLRLGRRRKDA
ncbi:MAG: hypothetical protein KDK02_07260 [Rhodobacteraceae bacterium]|nr:hypothetical protein [Paracoccaceae bacterium]